MIAGTANGAGAVHRLTGSNGTDGKRRSWIPVPDQQVNLSCQDLRDEGASEVAAELRGNRFLRKLYVGWNDIGDMGAGRLAEALEFNRTLLELDLTGNNMGDASAEKFVVALGRNSTLEMLKMQKNQIGAVGIDKLIYAYERSTALRVLDLKYNDFADDDQMDRLASVWRSKVPWDSEGYYSDGGFVEERADTGYLLQAHAGFDPLGPVRPGPLALPGDAASSYGLPDLRHYPSVSLPEAHFIDQAQVGAFDSSSIAVLTQAVASYVDRHADSPRYIRSLQRIAGQVRGADGGSGSAYRGCPFSCTT